jgi:hypothetical protein
LVYRPAGPGGPSSPQLSIHPISPPAIVTQLVHRLSLSAESAPPAPVMDGSAAPIDEPPPFDEVPDGDVEGGGSAAAEPSVVPVAGAGGFSRLVRDRFSFGPYSLSATERVGGKTSYEITCPFHRTRNKCCKELPFHDDASKTVAIKKLKLWAITGYAIDDDTDWGRGEHLTLKPKDMMVLDDAELQQMCPPSDDERIDALANQRAGASGVSESSGGRPSRE